MIFVATLAAAFAPGHSCSGICTFQNLSMAQEQLDWHVLDFHSQGWTEVQMNADTKVPYHKVDQRLASAQPGTVQLAVTQGPTHLQLWNSHSLLRSFNVFFFSVL